MYYKDKALGFSMSRSFEIDLIPDGGPTALHSFSTVFMAL